jgi:carbon storage regulator
MKTMLVLTRKVGERILIDGGIEVEVVSVKGSRVRLGIGAPTGVNIVRGELLEVEIDLSQHPSSGCLNS